MGLAQARSDDRELRPWLFRHLRLLGQGVDPAANDGAFGDYDDRSGKISFNPASGADIDLRACANISDDRAMNCQGLGDDIGADIRIWPDRQALVPNFDGSLDVAVDGHVLGAR